MKKVNHLNQIEICVTSVCNLHCKHCYQALSKNKYVLDYDLVKSVIDYGVQHGCQTFVLSGGEYFTYPYAYELLDYIIDKTKANITCITNSLLLDITKITEYPNERLNFKISIDGNEIEHDKRRGAGTYQSTKSKIKYLRNLGYKVGITMTLANDNWYTLAEILESSDYDDITLMPVANTGDATKHYSQQTDTVEYKELISHIYNQCREYRDEKHRCTIFPNGLSVNFDGSIYPCTLARDYGLMKIGNIYTQNINAEIDAYLESDDSNVLFEYKNNGQIIVCNECTMNYTCTRGCRIRALKWNGNLLTPDPFACKLFSGLYDDITYGDIYWGKHPHSNKKLP